jgi:nucleotidyltransferase/DNA polymerase involved in DNA repair
MKFASLYIPDFHVQAVIRVEPSLHGRAIAVVDREPPPFRVFALNEASRKAGAEYRMSRVEVATIPGLEVRQRSESAEISAQAALLDLARSFSPRFEHVAEDTVVLDLAGLEALLGTAEKIARRLARRARELGLGANVALAANPDAARVAARGFTGITLIPEGEEAAQLGKLPVQVLVGARNGVPLPDPLPEMQETLARWGIRTLRALAALPAAELSERLGQEGIRLQTLARGGSLRALVPAEESLHFEEAMDLEDPVAEIEPLAFILGRLLNQLCARLSARGQATQELQLVVGVDPSGVAEVPQADGEKNSVAKSPSSDEEGVRGWCQPNKGIGYHPGLRPPLLNGGGEFSSRTFDFRLSTFDLFTPRPPRSESRTLRLPFPTRDARLLLKLWMLELEAYPPSAPLLKLAIAAEPTRQRLAQGDLFLPRAPDPQKLELTLARIRGVVGEGKAGSPELLDTHRPDAFHMVPFGATKIANRKSKISKPRAPSPEPRNHYQISNFDCQTTLRRFRPPLEAKVEMQNGRPVRLESNRLRGDIVSAAGPWHTSGGWWTDHPWEHEEWDVEVRSVVRRPLSVAVTRNRTLNAGKAFYRIFQDQANGKWLISGTYD